VTQIGCGFNQSEHFRRVRSGRGAAVVARTNQRLFRPVVALVAVVAAALAYFVAEKLSEELLNSLVAIRDLQVAARTSSFTFKGKNDDVADIAHKLNVGAVLEGSVRKDGNQVRITAQLINASTGFHLWSQTYDRDLKNVLAPQTEIATAATKALQATLLADGQTEYANDHAPGAEIPSWFKRALALAPNDTGVLMRSGRFFATKTFGALYPTRL